MSDLSRSRRDFLKGSLLGAAALGLSVRPSFGSIFADDLSGKPKPGKIGDFKISLAEWSLNGACSAAGREDR